MQNTAPVLLPLGFVVSGSDFPLLRWIINVRFKLLSPAAFHPLTFWQGLSSHYWVMHPKTAKDFPQLATVTNDRQSSDPAYLADGICSSYMTRPNFTNIDTFH
jgi:hypothetical protein